MNRFGEVILQLCKIRKCQVISHKGNIIEIQSNSTTFHNDLIYFTTVCECYMATILGFTAWVENINNEKFTIELGYNY